MDTISMAYTIGYMGASLTTASFVMQVHKSHKTKRAGDLSLTTYLMIMVGIVLWTIYGLITSNPVMIIANTLTILIITFLLYLIVKHSKQIIDTNMRIFFITYFLVAMLSKYAFGVITMPMWLGWLTWKVFVGLMATPLTSFANFPQIFKILRRKSAEDISLLYYIIFVIGVTGWLIHGILLKDIALIVSTATSLTGSGTVLILKILRG